MIVQLPKDDPEVFSKYLNLLYMGQLPVRSPWGHSAQGVGQEFFWLAKIYVFCEKIRDMFSKKLVLDTFMVANLEIRTDGHTWQASPVIANTIYPRTRPGDPMRRLIVDIQAHKSDAAEIQGGEGLPYEFLKDLAIKLASKEPEGSKRGAFVPNVQDYLEVDVHDPKVKMETSRRS